jgi:putative hydrolase of the HAD superfamily
MTDNQHILERRITRLKAVSFDIGHTLINPYPSVGEVYAEIISSHGFVVAPDEAEVRFHHAWQAQRKTDGGLVYGVTHEEACLFWQAIVERVIVDGEGMAELLPVITRDLYERFSHADCWRLHPACQPLLELCRSLNLKIGFVSNWDLRLRNLLAELGLLELADAVVISAELVSEKPDPLIFQTALTQLQVSPAEMLHVGDTWQEDIVGACELGMPAAWLNHHGVPRPAGALEVLELTDLGELIPLLQAACG